MTRLVRAVWPDQGEVVLALGGERGLVTLHLSVGWVPYCMVLHSPVAVPGWTGPAMCAGLEGPCWCLSSITGGELADSMAADGAQGDDERTWTLLEGVYRLYLGRSRLCAWPGPRSLTRMTCCSSSAALPGPS